MPGKDRTRWVAVEGDHADDVTYGRLAQDPRETPSDEQRTAEEIEQTSEQVAAEQQADEQRLAEEDAAAADSEYDATTAAVELAGQLGVDLATVEGTGADGRITKADVENAAA